ncbi:hypothetical protein [Pseudovibrio sp. Ad26]|uniref:hypothetical protein n=1 Tax=Pseudovibrio sp. Ad26 TaxID=989410 RepID=UPI0007AE98EE|nr:hypothetical protein [Pseudovibrio sp. Ad26]KZK96970.1 hypothetical protein PsAD26_05370 [Pseudovibrio sp. Ad26]
MRLLAWVIFAIASGYIFWMMIIVGIVYLQLLDGYALHVTFKNYPWVDYVSAFGTILAAFGAVAAALIALFLERVRSKREAEAKRSMSSFYLSDICLYLEALFNAYQDLWVLAHDQREPTLSCLVSCELIREANFKVPDFPRDSADKLAQAVVFYKVEQAKAVQIFRSIQSMHTRASSMMMQTDDWGQSLLSDVEEIASVYSSVCSLFDWARRKKNGYGKVPYQLENALLNMGANEQIQAALAKF